jgi:valacyclovir hydrolase
MPFAAVATGAHLYYEDIGDGIPLIFIHGLMDVPRVHHPDLLAWLGSSYHVIAPSLRGYGQSMPKPRDFPPGFYRRDADDVLALLDALKIKQAHLLGYSDGGEVALLAAGLAPERFYSVVAWGAVGYFGPDMHAEAERAYPGDWIPEADRALHGITDIDPIMRQWVDSVQAMVAAGGDVSLGVADRIACPLLLLLGARDRLNPATYGQNFVDRTAQGRLVVIPDCGHAVHKEQPNAFQQTVGDFLRAASPAS